MNKVGPFGYADQMLQRFAFFCFFVTDFLVCFFVTDDVPAFFLSFFCNWGQMGPTVSDEPQRDSVETSVSSSISDAISFSTYGMTVKSYLKQWPTTGP